MKNRPLHNYIYTHVTSVALWSPCGHPVGLSHNSHPHQFQPRMYVQRAAVSERQLNSKLGTENSHFHHYTPGLWGRRFVPLFVANHPGRNRSMPVNLPPVSGTGYYLVCMRRPAVCLMLHRQKLRGGYTECRRLGSEGKRTAHFKLQDGCRAVHDLSSKNVYRL